MFIRAAVGIDACDRRKNKKGYGLCNNYEEQHNNILKNTMNGNKYANHEEDYQQKNLTFTNGTYTTKHVVMIRNVDYHREHEFDLELKENHIDTT